ncbi:hypothetical protein [Clostridium fermenticellae]|uniref:hypothetical protein n=1 Tax=Clostridium fermenticellae TaxID=2068654 RepID=UPI001FAA8DF8|nr:hypothetical protein [Clostridium fermenticellae]
MFPDFNSYCTNCFYRTVPPNFPGSNMFPYDQMTNTSKTSDTQGAEHSTSTNTQIDPPSRVAATTQSQNQTSDFAEAPGAPTNLGTEYTQGYLKTKIGKRVRMTFLLGTNNLQDRTGILTDVGISYVILKEESTGELTLGDIYSIKFVNIFP